MKIHVGGFGSRHVEELVLRSIYIEESIQQSELQATFHFQKL